MSNLIMIRVDYQNSICSHEAGFDALMTGYIFSKILKKNNILDLNIESQSNNYLKLCKNKVFNFHNNSISYKVYFK